jgi:hypothetical protein
VVFRFDEITTYIDQGLTPLCPKCDIDAVIVESSEQTISADLLRRLHVERFG